MSVASGSRWAWKVPQAEPGASSERADTALLAAIQGDEGTWDGDRVEVSRSQLKRLIEEGRVTADEAPLKAGLKLKPGARIRVEFPAPRPSRALAEDRPIDILFEDEHLVVLNKPPGLTVHPSSTQMEGTLVNALLHHIKDLSGIGGELRPGIVHRIDKDTSGALVISKTDQAHRKLVETFAAHAIERAYWALCFGAPSPPEGRIENRIGRNPKDRKKMALLPSGGRKAVTHYRTVEKYVEKAGKPFASFVEARLETGRTHQVRVHLTSLSCSLLGDPVYGTPTEKQGKWLLLPEPVRAAVRALPGQALHARVLGFEHPVTGEKLRFEAEPPPAFAALLETLRRNR